MFLLKKFAALFFLPVSLVTEIFIIGLFIIWFTKKQKAGKIIVTLGMVVLALLSYERVSDVLLKPLEQRYTPVMLESQLKETSPGIKPTVKWIAVLGGGSIEDEKVPVTSRLSPESLVRLTEAVRLYKKIPGSKIILSGGAVFGSRSEAETMSSLTEIMGVDPQDLVLEKTSRDTEEQASHIKSIVGKDQFVLVTSAYHMPRSMAIFEKQGLMPIAAPTNHRVVERQLVPSDYFPTSGGMRTAEMAFHEYLGILWSLLRNKI